MLVVAIFIGATLYGFSGPAGQQTMANYVKKFMPAASRRVLVTIGSAMVDAEVADTDDARQRGLTGRDSLGQNQGLLFIFDKSDIYPFWMKGMRFPLDIIWIEDGRVVEIASQVPVPLVEPSAITPKAKADQVLEVNAGFTEANNITIGSLVVAEFDDDGQQ